MSAQGRGPDSTLVHMSPREVSGLQSLAMANGGTLTINPKTGLPEAGFLDSLLPTLIGGAATFFSGGTITPIMAALGVTGLTALTSKDLGKGLMAGLGAYGGAGIVSGLAGFGAADIGEKAIGSATADAANAGFVNGSIGLDPTGINTSGADAYAKAVQKGVSDRMANASYSDRLAAGASKALSNPGDALSSIGGGNKFIGAAMIGAPLMSALTSQDQTSVPTAEEIKFDPRYTNINIRRQQRPYEPDTGSSGQRRYFGDTYVTQYGADGGAVLNDGIQHFAYGGGTIDPNYDYSGYGRKKTDAVTPRPNIPRPDIPRPDFVGADGKTYRYDPIKKNYYVIKEAPAKTNPGVETLMGGDGGFGGGQDKAPLPFTPITNNGFFSNILGRTTQDPAPVESRTENNAQQNFRALELANQNAQSIADMNKQTHIDLTTEYERTLQEADAAIKADQARQDEADEAVINSNNATQAANIAAAALVNTSTAPVPTPIATAGGMYVDAKNAARAEAAQAQAQTQVEAASGAAEANIAGYDSGMGNFGGGSDSFGEGQYNQGGYIGSYAQGGLGSLGGYSDGGRLLRGPGDGVSDSIPATVGNRQPARLADGEFVVPARIVSELGNGSTEAGARALYKMMDRIQANRRKTTGRTRVAVDSKSHKYLPA